MSDTLSKPASLKTPLSKEQKKPPQQSQRKSKPAPSGSLLAEGPIALDVVLNEQVEYAHHNRLLSLVFSQTIAIAILVTLLLFLAPFTRPIYNYFIRDPDKQIMAISPMMMPNVTNRAVLSWAVDSVTEIMTFGFGDMITQLGAQKPRFTPDGWASFVAAYKKQQISEVFEGNQLVATTVPSDTAVILAQGRNKQGIYEWKIQVPVIITYATNNNKSQVHHAIVTLTIVRVSPQQNPAGIAIKNLQVE